MDNDETFASDMVAVPGDAATAKPRGARASKPSRAKKPKAEKTLTQEMAALLEKRLLPDLTQRAGEPEVRRALQIRWEAERAQRRTAAEFDEWVGQTVEQVGAAWILSCLFVRVLEDRGYLDRHRLAGEGAEDSLHQFFEIAPALTERDYVLLVFRELMEVPSAADVFGPNHNPAWRLSPDNDCVRELLALLKQTDAEGRLRFGFAGTDTRFLGDLYQDLSEGVRKRFALLQTPDFVERFILDQTLEPAIKEFGLEEVRLIDPTCGSGHFLLGAFQRIFEHRLRTQPGIDRKDHAGAALGQVFGVDVNPYAVAIARFRLLLAYLECAGIDKLKRAPRIEANVVVADSLLHGAGQTRLSERTEDKAAWGDEMFALDEPERAEKVLGQRYHAVVGNPPYITCKDPVLREAYREVYVSAAGKYALSAPFTERFFQLGVPSGFVGLINANSFMKREFGKALIEKVLPTVELAQVIDTSGAYITGHGTPTVLLFGRNRPPVSATVKAVMGKRGEPSTPAEPEKGLVWSAISNHHANVGYEDDHISVVESEATSFRTHPWSLGGGGAAELKEYIEERFSSRLGQVVDDIGFASFTGLDELFIHPKDNLPRLGVPKELIRPIAIGEDVRDWSAMPSQDAFVPYGVEQDALGLDDSARWSKALWPYRTSAGAVTSFGGKTRHQCGENWWEWYRWQAGRYKAPFRITFAFVATHNHFVLDRGGKVFNRSAPIIKLPATAAEDDHLALLAYLNSSTACFWMKQVFMSKGGSGIGRGIQDEGWEARYEFDGTKLATLPVPFEGLAALTPYARELMRLAASLTDRLNDGRITEAEATFRRMVGLQEELDWEVYGLLGLVSTSDLAALRELSFQQLPPGHRPFEVKLFRDEEVAGRRTAWFERNAYQPPMPNDHPPAVQSRLDLIAKSAELDLMERPEYKRRWGVPDWKGIRVRNLQSQVLAEVEGMLKAPATRTLRSIQAELRERPPIQAVLAELGFSEAAEGLSQDILEDAVPFAAALRFSVAGIAKHQGWLRTWDLQRLEDQGQSVHIDVPEKYGSDDFATLTAWRLRGKLDVPKERFISYPGCERDDDKSPLLGWAGWDHLQRAQALAALFGARKDQDGWPKGRLQPILAGLLELVPWLKQWHNQPDSDGQSAGDAYELFVSENARALGLTLEDLRNWRPDKKAPARAAGASKGRGRAKLKSKTSRVTRDSDADSTDADSEELPS
jgi:hypothetical protein